MNQPSYCFVLRVVPVILASISITENLPAQTLPAAEGPKSGQKIAFVGDYVTEYGQNIPTGYVNLIADAFQKQGRRVNVIKDGKIAGSNELLAGLKADVLDQRPDWMTLSCGFNDCEGHRRTAGPVSLEEFKKNITSMVDQAGAAGIRVVILTATRVGGKEPPDPAKDGLAPYNDFLRALARERNLPLADVRAAEDAQLRLMAARWPHSPPGFFLSLDGERMNPAGDIVIATEVLKAMAFNDAQIAKARDAWMNISAQVSYPATASLSVRQCEHIHDIAESLGMSSNDLLMQTFNQTVQTLVNQAPPPKNE